MSIIKFKKSIMFYYICANVNSKKYPCSSIELGEKWCSSTYELTSITICPNNRYFKVIGDSY